MKNKYYKNKITKYLLNIDNYPALVTIINYWSKYSKRFFLVIHEDYNELTNYTFISGDDLSESLKISMQSLNAAFKTIKNRCYSEKN